jgi:hypothetical protein
MLNLRPSSLLHTKINHGISKIQVNQPTCKSGKPTVDGSRCSDIPVIPSRMKEVSMSLFKTKRTLSFRKISMAGPQDGTSDMLRTNRLIKLVNTTPSMASTATDNSTLSPREMVNTSRVATLLVEKQ